MRHPLLQDLDDLMAKNIITAETAAQIEQYYKNREPDSSGRLTTVLSILGALLLSSGIILIIAHNWDALGRTLRTIIAFLPLALGQILCLYAFLKKKNNRGWMESSAVLLFFAVPACISLIAQIYQINGSMSEFLLTWILLTLPLVFIMNASVVSLLLIALATWYAALLGYSEDTMPFRYLAVMAILLFHYLGYFKNPSPNFFHLHNWLIAISLSIVLGTFVKNGYDHHEWTFIGYMALSSVFYLLGASEVMKKKRLFANPYTFIGTIGIIMIFLIWTFSRAWNSFPVTQTKPNTITFNYGFAHISMGLLLVCAYLLWRQYKNSTEKQFDLMTLAPFIFTACVLLFYNNGLPGMLICNICVLAIGVYYIRKGIDRDHLGILNFGLLVIAVLAMFRFFDSDIPFIWRGLTFVATGAGFFVSNLLIIKKRRLASKKHIA